jgi:hypothetical protein
MNTHAFDHLAQRLVKDPSFLSEAESMELRELLIDYTEGLLDDQSKREVESLIQTSSTAAAIYAEFASTDTFLSTPEGKTLVAKSNEKTRAKLDDIIGIPSRKAPLFTEVVHVVSDALNQCLDNLSAAIADLFTFRATLATASGEEGLKRKLADGKTQIAVHSDSAGRLWLRVTSTAEEFRKGSFKLDIEPAPSVLTFTEVEPGLFSARVCVDEEAAAKLAEGAVPKLTPLPPTEG